MRMDRSYWNQKTAVLLASALSGFALVILLMRMPVINRSLALTIFIIFPILFSPFTLKTLSGRLWWGSYFIAMGSGTAAVLLGIHNPLSWFCAVVAGSAYSVGGYLRWNPLPPRP